MNKTIRKTLLAITLAGATGARAQYTVSPDDPKDFPKIVMQQIAPCWNPRRVSDSKPRISTVLRIRLNRDGSLRQKPEIVEQTPTTQADKSYADDLAADAIQAVVRCSPLKLPGSLYVGGWDDFNVALQSDRPN